MIYIKSINGGNLQKHYKGDIEQSMQKLPLRILIYVLGLFILAIGSALTINSNLGVSPVMALPYVTSEITGIYIGRITIIFFAVLLVVQIILLRRNFKWINLTQIIFSIIFGYFVDFAIWLLRGFMLPTYVGQVVMQVVGVICISLGIVLFMEAKLVPLSFEGMVDAVAQIVPNGKFHIWKMILDSAFLVISIILAFIFLGGIVGMREGTIFSAIFVGKLMPPLKKLLTPLLKLIEV